MNDIKKFGINLGMLALGLFVINTIINHTQTVPVLGTVGAKIKSGV